MNEARSGRIAGRWGSGNGTCIDERELDNPGTLRYIPARDLDTFIVVDAL